MTAFATASLQKGATRAVTHTAAETVFPFSASVVWLIGTFHSEVIPIGGGGVPLSTTERQHSRRPLCQTDIAPLAAKTTVASRNTAQGYSDRIPASLARINWPRAGREPLGDKTQRATGLSTKQRSSADFVTLELRFGVFLCSHRSLGGYPLFPRGLGSQGDQMILVEHLLHILWIDVWKVFGWA